MEASTIGFLVYLGISILLMLILSIKAYIKSEWKFNDKLGFFKAVFSMRSIYSAIVVHLYDTSTDIAILIAWGILAYNEIRGVKDYENVNIMSFLIPSILLIFVYRIAYAIIHHNILNSSRMSKKRDILLILSDLYIFKLVYIQFLTKYVSPCTMQMILQLLESVFESMPQLVMQSIFIIRIYNTDLAETNSIYIVFASIIASLLSIVTKFLINDHQWVSERAASSHFTYNHCPCISISYILVIIWRFCESIARFSIFTLLWSVIGGLYLPIYLLISIVIYLLLEEYTEILWISSKKGDKFQANRMYVFIWTLQSIVGIPLKRHLKMFIVRFIDNCIILCIIYSFAFEKFDCLLCHDKLERNAFQNPYILILSLISGIATIMAFIIYLGLYWMDIVKDCQRVQHVQIARPGFGIFDVQAARAAHPMMLDWFERRAQKIADHEHYVNETIWNETNLAIGPQGNIQTDTNSLELEVTNQNQYEDVIHETMTDSTNTAAFGSIAGIPIQSRKANVKKRIANDDECIGLNDDSDVSLSLC